MSVVIYVMVNANGLFAPYLNYSIKVSAMRVLYTSLAALSARACDGEKDDAICDRHIERGKEEDMYVRMYALFVFVYGAKGVRVRTTAE